MSVFQKGGRSKKMTTQQQTNNNNKGCQPFKYPGCQLSRRQRGLQQWGEVKKKEKSNSLFIPL